MLEGSRILVAGGAGMVGSAIQRELQRKGFLNVEGSRRQHVDFTDQAQTAEYFRRTKPEYVFMAAARVGGILANHEFPADFIRDNLLIETNIFDAARAVDVKKILFLGSSCIYPRDSPQPMQEEFLLTGPLEATNQWYAIAKIAGIKLAQAFRRQYGLSAISVMPTNLYGPGDNFDLNTAHVLPALIRKFHEGKTQGKRVVSIWGSGKPRREFLFVDDLARACVLLMEKYDAEEIINVGTGRDLTISELAFMIRKCVGFDGDVIFDPSKPDGTPQKLLDVQRISALGWKPRIGLQDGIEQSYAWFRRRYDPGS